MVFSASRKASTARLFSDPFAFAKLALVFLPHRCRFRKLNKSSSLGISNYVVTLELQSCTRVHI